MGRTSHLGLESIESCLKHNHDCLHTESHEFSLGVSLLLTTETWEKKKEKKEDKVTKRKGCLWGVPASTDLCVYSCQVDTWNRIYPAAMYAMLQPFCCYSPWDRSLDVALCVCGVKMEILVYANLLNHFPVIVNFFCSPLFLHYNPIKRSLKLLIWWSVTNSLIRILRDWIAEPKGIIIFERPFLLLMRSSQ